MNNRDTILIVDDNPQSLKLLMDILTNEGYRVRPANSGELALASAVVMPPDLVLLDLRMPDMDGFEVCRRLKARDESLKIPVIFISAETEMQERLAGLKLGAVDFITKPFHREELLARVRTHLELNRLRNQLEQQVAERTAQLQDANKQILSELAERKRMDEALRYSEEKYRTLFEMSPESILLLSLDGTILDFNPAAASLSGSAKEIKPNQSILELGSVRTEDKPHLVELLSQVINGHLSDVLELDLLLDTNENRQIEVYPLLLKHGDEPYAIQVIIHDVTERKRAEQALRLTLEKQLELGEFRSRIITTLSHEFRTPLAVILSSSEMLQHHGDKMAEHDRALRFGKISSSVQYTTFLLDDALTINQAQFGELEFRPAPLDVAAFCQKMITEVQTTRKPSARFVFASTGNGTEAIVDERLLRHIMSNLFSNAIKFSPPDSAISICLARDPEQVVLKVQDRGIGIPKADQSQLFGLFYRAENIGTARGMGLGLAIVKECVDLHGGTITFESEEGLGTTFTVVLPQGPIEK